MGGSGPSRANKFPAAEVPATGTEAVTAEAAVPGATSEEVDAARVAARGGYNTGQGGYRY
jgi:hypothetical protein